MLVAHQLWLKKHHLLPLISARMYIYPTDDPAYEYYHRSLFRLAAVQRGHCQILPPALQSYESGKVLISFHLFH